MPRAIAGSPRRSVDGSNGTLGAAMSTHGLFIVHRTQPGRRDDVRAVWNEHMAPAIDANDDHLAYIYSFATADEAVLRVFQLYARADAAAELLETERYERHIDRKSTRLNYSP